MDNLTPAREVQSISNLKDAFQTRKRREEKESSYCSTASSEPTDEEIMDIVQRKPRIPLRPKLSTKQDANFNVVKPKRWSDYRASWNQVVHNHHGSSLSKSEQVEIIFIVK